jgi:hypothetical protein
MIDIVELTDKEVLIIILLTIPFIVLYLSSKKWDISLYDCFLGD